MGVLVKNKINYTGSGAKEEIITYAQYLALSEEQRNNGTTYYVNDINGDGENFQPIIYSTDEREVGVWIDGRPLYEKTFTGQLSGTSLHINIAGLDIDKGWVYDGYYDIGVTMLGINEFIGGNAYTRTHVNPDSQYLYIDCSNSQANNSTVVVTIRYTKTTDTPGSGTWTPQGVPAQHYSTNEQIVGTWIDGSTIYEKTFVLTSSLTIQTEWTNTGFYILDAEKIISCEVIRIDSKGSWCLHSGIDNSTKQILLSSYGMTTISLSVGSTITLRYTKSTS